MKSINHIFFLLIFVFGMQTESLATTYTFSTTGEWTEVSNWDVYPGEVLIASDTVFILENVEIGAGVNIVTDGYISTEVGDVMTVNGSITVTGTFLQDGNVVNNGTAEISGTTYFINGTVANNGDYTIDTEAFLDFTFDNFGNLEIGNSGVLNLTTNPGFVNHGSGVVTVNGTFAASAGFVNNGTINVNGALEKISIISGQIINNSSINVFGTAVIEGPFVNSMTSTLSLEVGSNADFSNDSSLSNSGFISIEGIMNVSNMGTFNQNGSISIASGGQLNMVDDLPSVLTL